MRYLRHNDESGMIMIAVMIVALISSVLLTAFMRTVLDESKDSASNMEKTQALFLAEAGLKRGLYFLNNRDEPGNPWTDNLDHQNGTFLSTPEVYVGNELDDGTGRFPEFYRISLFDQFTDEYGSVADLPDRYFMIKSAGVIQRSLPTRQRLAAIVSKPVKLMEIPAALNFFDGADPEDELIQFSSNQWVVSGIDIDDPLETEGVRAIAVANTGDNIAGQLGKRAVNLESGSYDVEYTDESGNLVTLTVYADSNYLVSDIREFDADFTGSTIKKATDEYYIDESNILEDANLPQNTDSYMNLFMEDSELNTIYGPLTYPNDLLGSATDPKIVYADVSGGAIVMPGGLSGYGVLIVQGPGEFQLSGNSDWYGLVICTGGAGLALRGGGTTKSHIYGAVIIGDGDLTMNGTADIRYSSSAMEMVGDFLVEYDLVSWCGGWNGHLAKLQ